MKKGFTLIELLAVIIILAIIALIATPIVLDVVEDAKKSGYKSSALGILDTAKLYYTDSFMDNDKQSKLDGKTNLLDEFIINGDKPDSGYVRINEHGRIAMAIVYNNTCYTKDFMDSVLKEDFDYENCEISYMDSVLNGADPELDEGMIPVIIDASGNLTKADTKEKWYDYANKQWANVVLVTESSRNGYIKAEPRSEIKQEDVLAYFVWIPRYRYQLFADINSLTVNQNPSVNKTHLINIEFENKDEKKETGSMKYEWLTHPAFTFGEDELNGIWVGKFETTGTKETPTVLPNKTSLTNEMVSTLFQTSLKFAGNALSNDGSINHSNNTAYGINNIDSHMMKNMEWGAVAYLTTSIYGQGINEIRTNNSLNYMTGCAATTIPTKAYGEYLQQTDHTEGYYVGCENAYNTSIGVLASTTGNITGIYDMSGGAWEYMMGIMADEENINPFSGRNDLYNSGFTGNISCPDCDLEKGNDSSVKYINGITYPNSKYYDLYEYNISGVFRTNKLGDFTTELEILYYYTNDTGTRYYSNWNGDHAHFIGPTLPFYVRGGHALYGTGSGIYATGNHDGSASYWMGFRTVLTK